MSSQVGFIQKYVYNNVVSIGSKAIYLLLKPKKIKKIYQKSTSLCSIYKYKKHLLDVMRKMGFSE